MKTNTILIIVGTLIVAALAYWYFFTGTGNQPPLSTDVPTNQAQMQFETLVGELQPVSFNTGIFSDTRFNALVDITTPVAPESIGRLDPLAPISASASAAPTPVVAPAPVVTPAPPTPATPATSTSTPATSGP